LIAEFRLLAIDKKVKVPIWFDRPIYFRLVSKKVLAKRVEVRD
jgi:hypothetical protein